MLLIGTKVTGEVNSYDLGEEGEVVEMVITRESDGAQTSFLHFMLDDLKRPKRSSASW